MPHDAFAFVLCEMVNLQGSLDFAKAEVLCKLFLANVAGQKCFDVRNIFKDLSVHK